MKKVSWVVLMAAVFLVWSLTFAATQEEELARVQQAIAAAGAQWTAGINEITRLPLDTFKSMLGAEITAPEQHPGDVILQNEAAPLTTPAYFTWRFSQGADWTSPIRDQASCGSCTTFATVGAFEALLKIYNHNPNLNIDLSEEHLFMCSGGGCQVGATIQSPAMYVVNSGIPDEACFPYTATDQPCSNTCPDWQQRVQKAGSWKQVTGGDAGIKTALLDAPVISTFMVYDDFRYYQTGVYQHVTGSYLGGHAICIVGWNDSENSWIVKNSWGQGWGEQGWFRILRGNCTIGGNNIALSMDTSGGCASEDLAAGTGVWDKLEPLREFREQFLRVNENGQRWVSLYEGLSPEVTALAMQNRELRLALLRAVVTASNVADKAIRTNMIRFTPGQLAIITKSLELLRTGASPALLKTINEIEQAFASANGKSVAAAFTDTTF